jgi:hypothetical protein
LKTCPDWVRSVLSVKTPAFGSGKSTRSRFNTLHELVRTVSSESMNYQNIPGGLV